MNIKKKLVKGIVILTALVFFFLISFVTLMEVTGEKYLNEKNDIVSFIKNSPPIPDNFVEVFEKVYPRSIDGNYWTYFVERTFSDSNRKCPCKMAALFIPNEKIDYSRGYYSTMPGMIALELEDYVSQKECLNYVYNNFQFGNDIIGVRSASENFFNKSLEELNQKEIVSILTMLENPVLYSIRRNPKAHNKKRSELLRKLGTTSVN
ncbi:transglycosylase domain-containing protein [Salinimicrobium gaetbulicola]|uniref:Transglycosylase domain-containing protein n=1 Tax=Salinimicrobium gaetbulicola TaxID=999702 RepID=A0ABW3IBK3_9FLAO